MWAVDAAERVKFSLQHVTDPFPVDGTPSDGPMPGRTIRSNSFLSLKVDVGLCQRCRQLIFEELF